MSESTSTLELKQETLRVLDDDQLADIHGGTDDSGQQQAVAASQLDGGSGDS
ncbi:MAG: hypothetical protein ABIF77_00825 [bacterium]